MKFAKFLGLLLGLVATLLPFAASASPIEDVQIKQLDDGYEIRVNFLFFQMRYLSASGSNPGDDINVHLQLTNSNSLTSSQLSELNGSQTASWNKLPGMSLQSIVFDGGNDVNNETLIVRFSHPVSYKMRSSSDLRSLVIHVYETLPNTQEKTGSSETSAIPPAPVVAALTPEKAAQPSPNISPDEVKGANIPQEDKAALEEARQEFLKKHYIRAIVIYSSVADRSSGEAKMQAMEFLGLAREKIGQFAIARDVYEKYLSLFPASPNASRVKQRLEGVITAGQLPRERLKDKPSLPSATAQSATGVTPVPQIHTAPRQPVPESPEWKTSISGSVTELYNYDSIAVTTSPNTTKTIVRNDISSFLDTTATAKNNVYEFKTRFSGSEFNSFEPGKDPRARVNAAFVEGREKDIGILARVGRQSLSSGGVLGRFDGAYFSYLASDIVKVNFVGGFPVATTHSPINVNSRFVGTNVDIDAFDKKWKFNVFAIDQYYQNFVDRQAIGGEVRNSTPGHSIFSLVDYDVYYNSLNIFMVNNQWNFKEIDTSIYGTLDYRKTPPMLTENALQGQSVNSLRSLNDIFNEAQIEDLARSRTATSKMVTLGAMYDYSPDFQINPEFMVTYLSGTPTSANLDPATGLVDNAGIAASPSIGYEYTYGMTLVNNNIIKEGDNLLTSLRYGDLHDGHEYTLTLSGHYPFTQEFQFSPQFRADEFANTSTGGTRLKLRPDVKFDYYITKDVDLQFEGGIEWTNDNTQSPSQNSLEPFFVTGFRYSF